MHYLLNLNISTPKPVKTNTKNVKQNANTKTADRSE